MVKAHYVQGNLARSTSLHLKYIEREGVALNAERGLLYGALEDASATADVAAHAIRERLSVPIDGEQHQFRWIISPEDGARLDLTEYTRELMRRVERDLGTELVWGAVNHYNTDNPHVHVVIRGVDARGAEVRFDRAYISFGLRHRAQELATEELGPRTQFEHDAQLAREVSQQRWTSLDRAITRHEVDGVVSEEALTPIQRERVRMLHRMNLAEPCAGQSWPLAAGWQERLREDGMRGDIIKQMHRELRGDVARYVVLDRRQELPRHPLEPETLQGRVVSIGLSERGVDSYHAVVETPSGGGYLVPLWPSEMAELRRGDLVTLRDRAAPRERSVDQVLEALASTHEHRRIEGVEPYQRKRLKELARMGLATRVEGQAYQVSAGFLERLRQLDREQPLTRVGLVRERESLDRMTRRLEKTWLDRVPVVQSASEFGRLIRERKAARAAVLQSGGIPVNYAWLSRAERLRGEADGQLSGRVVSIVQAGKRRVAVIQTEAEAGVCVPLTHYEAQALRKDDLIAVRERAVSWSRPEDDAIAAKALAGGLVRLPAALEQRLQQLKWLGLARRKDGEWEVSPDLKRQLASRDVQQPKHRLQLRAASQTLDEQVRYLGPTWLDRASPALPGIAAAKAARERFLNEQGITTGARREGILRELERVSMLRRSSEQLGRTTESLHGYEGVVREVRYAPSGNAYAVLDNDRGLQVVAVDAGSRDVIGKHVAVHGRGLVLKDCETQPEPER